LELVLLKKPYSLHNIGFSVEMSLTDGEIYRQSLLLYFIFSTQAAQRPVSPAAGETPIHFGIRTNFGTPLTNFTGRIPAVGVQTDVGRFFFCYDFVFCTTKPGFSLLYLITHK
jgi:hypothetical protein